MSKADIRSDILLDLLDEIGIKLTREQADSVSDGFATHLECEREMESYQFTGGDRSCPDCKTKQKRIDKLEDDMRVFSDGIVRRMGLDERSCAYVENGRVVISEPMR